VTGYLLAAARYENAEPREHHAACDDRDTFGNWYRCGECRHVWHASKNARGPANNCPGCGCLFGIGHADCVCAEIEATYA